MKSLDELKQSWSEKQDTFSSANIYTPETLQKVIQARLKQYTLNSFQYFWASFVLQLIVYALLSHVIVKYWNHNEALLLSALGIVLYVPFTIVLMRKFKRLAFLMPGKRNVNPKSLYKHIQEQKILLTSFYRFKRIYEWFLIPVSSAIGVFLVFQLYVPGGVRHHLSGAVITYAVTILLCLTAIVKENQKSFKKPIWHLEELIKEFEMEE